MSSMLSRLAVASALAAGTLLGAGVSAPADAETLRLGHNAAPLSSEAKALEEFARLVGEKSNGELTVEVFHGGSLGAPVAQIENLQLGTQALHGNVADWNQHLDKDWAALAMPFLFSGTEHVRQFQETDTYAEMKQRLVDDSGIRVIADNWYRLPKVLITQTPVFKPADLKGMKLRMPNLDTYIDTWTALGAKPTVVDWSEAYLAMKTGTVVGMDTPLSGIYPQKFHQAAPFVTMTNHLSAPYNVLISEPVWQGLSEDERQVLTEAAQEAGDFYTRLIEDEFADQKRKMLAEGAVFIETDVTPFVEMARDVMRDFEAEGMWSEGMVDDILALTGPSQAPVAAAATD